MPLSCNHLTPFLTVSSVVSSFFAIETYDFLMSGWRHLLGTSVMSSRSMPVSNRSNYGADIGFTGSGYKASQHALISMAV